MGRQLKGLLYFFITDVRRNLQIFWGILIGTLSLTFAVAYLLLSFGETKMVFVIPFALYIFCSIFGFVFVKKNIPFSIKMGATRKNIFISLGIFFLGLSIVKAVAASTLQAILAYLIKITDAHTFTLMHPAQWLEDTWLNRVIIDASVMFFLLFTLFLLGLIFYKYGMLAGGSLLGIAVVLLLLGIAQGWIVDFFIQFFQNLHIAMFFQVLLVGFVLYVITWLMIRKITIINV